ncbi:MAG: hypothetical protein M0D57_07495 [Sphingobacteriales bacterium JAD_PAG50586_3]|nr:MAG: hypothetical protein M0D57_07495 [Sphingobacteriales bacterium JAD_PAG50586_3]
MMLQRTKLPLGILALVVTLILVKTLFNAWNKPHLADDGTISYKKSAAGDDYLYKINDTIAFQVRLLPTMGAVSSEVVSYHQVGGV